MIDFLKNLRKQRAAATSAIGSMNGTVAEVRALISEAGAKVNAAKSALPARAGVEADARHQIELAAGRGAVSLRQTVTRAVQGNGIDPFASVKTVDDARDLLALVAGDALVAAFSAALDQRYRDQPGMTEAERDEAHAAAEGERIALELAEERLIRDAAEAGIAIERRRDLHPAVRLAPLLALPE